MKLLPEIEAYLQAVEKDFDTIPPARKTALKKIAQGIEQLLSTNGQASLIYICTHNSRRSHMGQLWAAAAASYYQLQGITTYSGGTEITALHPNAIKALQQAGFEVNGTTPASNPHYAVTYAIDTAPVITFSKKYMEAPNPTSNFIAVMTCSHADENCPLVAGAALKVATPYHDPKESDGTATQDITYQSRSRQIATEVLYTFSLVQQTKL